MWLSEGQLFDQQFEEMVKHYNEYHQINPLNPDPLLKKHNKIFGIVPNQRHLDQLSYMNLLSKTYLTKNERKTMKKLETFLNSDKMTHKELYVYQDLIRKRSNLEIDNRQYQKQMEEATPEVLMP